MAKFYGMIGFVFTKKTVPGVFKEESEEHPYYGDITRNNRKWENGEGLNDDFNITNLISIVADKFAYENIGAMRYVEYLGTKWKIKDVDIERPRLILSIGGIYNGE